MSAFEPDPWDDLRSPTLAVWGTRIMREEYSVKRKAAETERMQATIRKWRITPEERIRLAAERGRAASSKARRERLDREKDARAREGGE